MVKEFIFDLGNVIIKWDPKYIVSKYSGDTDVQEMLLKEVFGSTYWLEYDHGTISREIVKEKVHLHTDTQYHSIIDAMIHDWHKHCPSIVGMEKIIVELKEKGYGIYLLSNTNIHFDEYKDTIPVLKYFDGYYISAKYKLVKPNIEIFQSFASTFNLTLEECLFIDDIQMNIDGAKKAGMQGYCFDGNIEKFKEYLKKENF